VKIEFLTFNWEIRIMKIRYSKVFAFLAAAVLMVVNVGQSQAAYVASFNNTATVITPGTGIGDEAPQVGNPNAEPGGATLLGVDNGGGQTAGAFTLAVGQSRVFTATALNFNQAEGNIVTAELDNVGYGVGLTLTDPDGNVQNISFTLAGTAFINAVDDAAVDYTLASPATQTFSFGGPSIPVSGKGHYTVSIAGTSLSRRGEFKGLVATVTLVSQPVPEPTSMALLGLGAIGAAVSSYRRKRAA
jgi:hypothetical protein